MRRGPAPPDKHRFPTSSQLPPPRVPSHSSHMPPLAVPTTSTPRLARSLTSSGTIPGASSFGPYPPSVPRLATTGSTTSTATAPLTPTTTTTTTTTATTTATTATTALPAITQLQLPPLSSLPSARSPSRRARPPSTRAIAPPGYTSGRSPTGLYKHAGYVADGGGGPSDSTRGGAATALAVQPNAGYVDARLGGGEGQMPQHQHQSIQRPASHAVHPAPHSPGIYHAVSCLPQQHGLHPAVPLLPPATTMVATASSLSPPSPPHPQQQNPQQQHEIAIPPHKPQHGLRLAVEAGATSMRQPPFMKHHSSSNRLIEKRKRDIATPSNSSIAAYSSLLTPFIYKLYCLVSDKATNNLCHWSSAGDSFVVPNPTAFASTVLPQYFKHNQFASFVRQLNKYRFHKLTPGTCIFGHEKFIRDRPDLLSEIVRQRSPDRSTSAVGATSVGSMAPGVESPSLLSPAPSGADATGSSFPVRRPQYAGAPPHSARPAPSAAPTPPPAPPAVVTEAQRAGSSPALTGDNGARVAVDFTRTCVDVKAECDAPTIGLVRASAPGPHGSGELGKQLEGSGCVVHDTTGVIEGAASVGNEGSVTARGAFRKERVQRAPVHGRIWEWGEGMGRQEVAKLRNDVNSLLEERQVALGRITVLEDAVRRLNRSVAELRGEERRNQL